MIFRVLNLVNSQCMHFRVLECFIRCRVMVCALCASRCWLVCVLYTLQFVDMRVFYAMQGVGMCVLYAVKDYDSHLVSTWERGPNPVCHKVPLRSSRVYGGTT